MTRPSWHTPPDAATRAWIERAAGPEWRVIRANRLSGGIAAGVDGVTLVGPAGSTRRLVLKRWLRPGWEVDDAQYTAAREAEVLRRLVATPVPVPVVVALDEDGAEAGAPAILMTHVDGRHPSLADEGRPARIAAMAEALVVVHAVDRGMRDVVGEFECYTALDRVVRRRVPAGPGSGGRRSSVSPPRLRRGRASSCTATITRGTRCGTVAGWPAVVDWTNASWGEPAMDLAHWRANLGTVHGLEVADRVVDAYAAAGGSPADQAWWDVRILLDFIGDEDWSGPHSIATAEAYLEALLQRW